MTKRLLIFVLLLGAAGAAAQNSRYDNIAMGKLPGGNVLQALPNAIVTVMACASMSTSCTTSAQLCSSITDTNCNASNTVFADAGGNFHFYAKPGRYSVSIQAPSFAGFTIPDVILPVSATDGGGGGGTSVTVNGTAAVPNALNFNSNAPLPPTGSTTVQWNLNGNNVLGYITGGGGGGGTPFTVNGVAPTGVVNFNASTPLPPPGGINVNWTLVGTNLTAAIVGDGNPNSCLLGTGIFAACPGGGGGGATLPTIPVWNLFASTGTGGAQDSGVAAEAGFVRAQVLEASGATGTAPSGFTPPNGSIEYFPTGATYGGVTVGAANGVAMHFSHSNVSGQAGNGGIALAGGNSGGVGTSYQIYLDCEQATGCVSPQLPLGASQINVTGSGGIAMTGAGGTLPTPAANSGGIGIGPGNVPQYYSNGGPWTAIGSGGGGGGTTVSINGTSAGSALNFTNTATSPPSNGAPITWTPLASGATSGYLVGSGNTTDCLLGTGAFGPCVSGGSVPNPWTSTGTALTPVAGQGGFGISTGGMPFMSQNGGVWVPVPRFQVNTGYIANAATIINFSGTNANPPVCNPVAPTNGRCITFQQSTGGTNNISAALVGDGSANCLSGTGTYVPCGTGSGGSGTVGTGTNGQFAVYSAATSVVGSAVLNDTGTLINSTEPITAPSFVLPAAGEVQGAGGSPVPNPSTGSFAFLSGGLPAFSQNGGAFNAFKLTAVNGITLPASSTLTNFSSTGITNPTNGWPITFGLLGSQISGALIGDGSSNCFVGTGTFVPCVPNPILSSAGTTLPAPQSGQGAIGISTGGVPQISVSGGAWTAIPTVAGGSGTVSANNGTAGALAYYAAAAGSTTVGNTTQAVVTSTGINFGNVSLLQFGPSLSGSGMDVNLGRGGSGVLAVGSGSGASASETGYIRSNNSCAQTAAISFSNTGLASTLCPRSFPASAKAWIIHCVLPWNFTAGNTGNATVTVGFTYSQVPVSATFFTTVLWGTSGPVWGTSQVTTASGPQSFYTTGSLVSTDTSMYTFFIDGVLNASASGGTMSITATTNSATASGQINAGAYCRFQ